MGTPTNRLDIDRSNIHEWIERLYAPEGREAFVAWEKEVEASDSQEGLLFRVALEDGVTRGQPYAQARAFLAEVLIAQVGNAEEQLDQVSPLTAQLLQRLATVTPQAGAARLLFSDSAFNDEPARQLASWAGPVPEMPAVDFLARTLAAKNEFEGFSVAAVLHALDSNVRGLLETFSDLGVDYSKIALIDKDYSTHRASVRYAEHRGAQHVRVPGIGASASGRVEMLHRADAALRDIIATLPEPEGDGVLRPRVLILDDGGYLIRRLHQVPEFRRYAEYFSALELTRKGIRDVRRLIAEEICTQGIDGARAIIAREAGALPPEAQTHWAEHSRGRLQAELRHVPAAAEHLLRQPDNAEALARVPDRAVLFVLQELLNAAGDDTVNRILEEFESRGDPILGCAVGNLADAPEIKLHAEAELVAHSIAVEADAAVEHIRASGISLGKTAVVVGAGGANGAPIALDLANMGYEVLAVERSSVPLPEHPNIRSCALEDALPDGDLVVSCAGERTLFEDHYPLLKQHAVICQGASDDEELGVRDASRWATQPKRRDDSDGYMWTRVDGRFVCLGHQRLQPHTISALRIKESGRLVFFPNQGKVINFNATADPIPPRYIQVTRAGVLGLSVLTRRSPTARLISLPTDLEREIVGVTERALGKTRESLFRPTWSATTPALPTTPPAEFLQRQGNANRPVHTVEINVGLSDSESARLRDATHPRERYRLGRVQPGSFEEIVLRRLGVTGDELRIEHAAADTAVHAFWDVFGADAMDVRLSFATATANPSYGNPGDRLAMTGTGPGDDEFTVFLGGFLRHLIGTHGAKIRRRELSLPELADAIRDGFGAAGAQLESYVAHLRASQSAEDRALAARLVTG